MKFQPIDIKNLSRKQRYGIILIPVGVTLLTTVSTGVGAAIMGLGAVFFLLGGGGK